MNNRSTGPLYRDDWLDHMFPLVTGDGKSALADLNTPIRRYDFMRLCGGETPLRQIADHPDYGFVRMMATFQELFMEGWVDVRLRLPNDFERFRIGEFLVSAGITSHEHLQRALQIQGKPVCESLQELGALNPLQVKFALRIQTLYRLASSDAGQNLQFVQNPTKDSAARA